MTDTPQTPAAEAAIAETPAVVQEEASAVEETPAPAVPATPEVDERALRRIGWVLGGMTVFCGAMGVLTSVYPSEQFNNAAPVAEAAPQINGVQAASNVPAPQRPQVRSGSPR